MSRPTKDNARWLWMGGPLEPTPELTAWLGRMDATWWLEPDLLQQSGCTLVLRPTGSKAEPVRVPPGATLAHDGRRFQVLDQEALQAPMLTVVADAEPDPPQAQPPGDSHPAGDLETIPHRHTRRGDVCSLCALGWPCDAVRASKLAQELKTQLAELHDKCDASERAGYGNIRLSDVRALTYDPRDDPWPGPSEQGRHAMLREVIRGLERFLEQPPDVQQRCLVLLEQERPDTARRVREFLGVSAAEDRGAR